MRRASLKAGMMTERYRCVLGSLEVTPAPQIVGSLAEQGGDCKDLTIRLGRANV